MPDYVVEPEYPVENKENSDSDDYIEKLLKEIRDQDNYNEEPSEEITPKVNPKWKGNFIYFYLDYFFKCNYYFLTRSKSCKKLFLHPYLTISISFFK